MQPNSKISSEDIRENSADMSRYGENRAERERAPTAYMLDIFMSRNPHRVIPFLIIASGIR
jgi:hypothetical protein